MARRRFQAGSVFECGRRVKIWKGRYREDVIGPDGITRRVKRAVVLGTKSEYPTKRLAQRALQNHLARINAPDYRPGRISTVAEFAERWRSQVLALRKPSTVKACESHLKIHILPWFGKHRVDQIGLESQQVFVNRLAGKVSRKTLLNVLGTLSAMLNRAKDWGYVCEGVQIRKLVLPERGIKQPVRFFTAEECRRIISVAENPFRAMYALAAMTGMRAGEILGLRLEDVDFERETLRVVQTSWCGQIQTAKTPGSEDVLPLPRPLAAILRQHLQAWEKNPGQLLFINRHGRPFVAEKVVARHLGPLLARLHIQHGGFHAFRHAHSSLLIDGGASVKVAQEQLRHTDPRMTLGRYTHIIGDARRMAVEKLASILAPNGPESETDEAYIQ